MLNMKNIVIGFFCILIFFSCETKRDDAVKTKKRPSALANGKIFELEGKKFLYGGKDSTWHFDVSNSPLIDSQYHYGIGREQFHALINPQFMTEAEAKEIYSDTSRFLLFTLGGETRAYGIDLLTHHEVVNDIVNGEPVAAAYCILADLGAMYSRRVGDTVLTFALSGYTYYDPKVWDGLDGFIWWDRETESTWWPLISKGVSGPLKEVPLKVLNEKSWSQTTWGNIVGKYDNLKVLKPDQSMEVPQHWPKFDKQTTERILHQETAQAESPPKWGENSHN